MATAMEDALGSLASGMAGELKRLGYSRRTAARQMQLAGELSRFLQQRDRTASELDAELVEEFCSTLRTKSGGWRPTPKALTWLVTYLRRVGVATITTPPALQSPVDQLADRYRRYLLSERGLAEETVVEYVRVTAPFLREHAGRGLDTLVAGDISKFMTHACRSISSRAAERLATALRSFLGLALLEGLIATSLAGAVPSAARWSGASLPRGLAPGTGDRTLDELRPEPSDRNTRLGHLGVARPPRVACCRGRKGSAKVDDQANTGTSA